MTYDIKALAKEAAPRPNGAEVALPPIQERIGSVKAYRAALRKMLREVAKEVREGVIPAYQAERRRGGLTLDGPEDWFASLYSLRRALTAIAEQTMRRVLDLEAERHTERFIETARSALGIDLTAVIRREGIGAALNTARARNVSLITGLADDTIRGIEQAVHVAHANGQSVKALRSELQRKFGIAGRRADLIAQDQMSKLTSDLNKIRQTEAGITEYVWMTSRDERVRSLHRSLDGKKYKWGETTGAEGGLPPGQPIRCRCVARAVVVF